MSSLASPPRRDLIAIYLGAFIVFAASGRLLRSPGYMDAEYYLTTGAELAAGRGFQEPFLWNYLDDPDGLPHLSHVYWMPLASVVAAIGMRVGAVDFRSGQIGFLLAAAALPVVTYSIGWGLQRSRERARLAAGLALASGLFFPFLLTTDTFGAYALIGSAAIVAMSPGEAPWSWRRSLGLGALIALAHLTRADGVLLAAPAAWMILKAKGQRLRVAAVTLVGYLLAISPWLVRNVLDTGAIWPGSAGKTLWLLSYDETFSYPASLLTIQHWMSAGVVQLALDRLSAFWTNLRSLWLVNAQIFLAPLMILGGWHLRRAPVVRAAGAYLAVLVAAMSFVFPFAGSRGGFFHSSSALQPILLALVPSGLEVFSRFGARVRKWEPARSERVFALAAFLLAFGFTVWATWSRLTGDGRGAGWERNTQTYEAAAAALPASPGLIAVNDPPGLYAATGVPAIVIPNGGEDTLRLVVERYAAAWVLLERNHPEGLDDLYLDPSPRDFLDVPVVLSDAAGEPMYLFRVLTP